MPRLPFQPFDRDKAVRIYRNKLPHWRQDGATYFVTFRLSDSIPRSVLSDWEEHKRNYLRSRHGIEMDTAGKWRAAIERLPPEDRAAYQREFSRTLNDYLDEGRGSCILRQPACAEIVESVALNFDGGRYDLGEMVVMPNHVHLLITPYTGVRLEKELQGIKGVSAKRINAALSREGKLWQKDSYDHIVRTTEDLAAFQAYVRENPTKAKLRPGEFRLYEP